MSVRTALQWRLAFATGRTPGSGGPIAGRTWRPSASCSRTQARSWTFPTSFGRRHRLGAGDPLGRVTELARKGGRKAAVVGVARTPGNLLHLQIGSTQQLAGKLKSAPAHKLCRCL